MTPNAAAWTTAILVGIAGIVTPPAPADESGLETRRVALFSSGVGFFERQAVVSDDARAELKFRTDQINDILKSMVVQDLDGGTVGVVSYASRDPIEKTLRSFGVDLTGNPSLGRLLDQLRGEPVEIAGARAVTGTVVGVETHKKQTEHGLIEQDVLNVLTEAGIQQIPLTDVQGVRFSDKKIDAELRNALATLASGHDADKKGVVLHFNGKGERRVKVSYLLEAPLWKTSYRLVLSDTEKPFLQGWAVVENATEEDWQDVRLSLISGRPISFRMDLYTPIYVPRPLEELELYASLRPPEYEGAMDFKPVLEREEPRAMAAPAPARRRALAMEAAADYDDDASAGLALAGTGVASVATAQEAGELFEYVISTPVSIARQHSAMLPIVNEPVEGEKVSIYNPATHAKYPLNGLQLTNSTSLHLMQGPVTIFDANVYAGDAKLPDLTAGEKRLISYALDLSAEVMVEHKSHPDLIVSLRVAKGVLWHKHKYVDERTYVVKNKAGKPKTVLLEQPYSGDWKLIEPAEPFERTPQMLRFRVAVPGGETAKQTVQLERVADQSVALSSLSTDQIRLYLRTPTIKPEVAKALERAIELQTAFVDAQREREKLERELNETLAEQERLRRNLGSVPRNTDSYERQLKLFDEAETQIARSRDQVRAARETEAARREDLERYLLALDVG